MLKAGIQVISQIMTFIQAILAGYFSNLLLEPGTKPDHTILARHLWALCYLNSSVTVPIRAALQQRGNAKVLLIPVSKESTHKGAGWQSQPLYQLPASCCTLDHSPPEWYLKKS